MKKLDIAHNQSIKLNDDERRQLRESLISYMEKVPVLPQDEMMSLHRKSRSGWIVGVLAGIIIAGAGVSFAADRTQPGGILYPIKIGITEKIRALWTSPVQNTAIDTSAAATLVSASTTSSQ